MKGSRSFPYLVPLIALGLVGFGFLRGYEETRHMFSWVGGGGVLLAAGYLVRSRWIRWGRRDGWIRFHQAFALTGSGLILIHAAFRPYSWHAALALFLVLLAVGSGMWLNFRKGMERRQWRYVHLALMPLVLVGAGLHAYLRPQHDAYFPLKATYHQVTCGQCHVGDRSYRTNSCLGCHPHNTPYVVETHQLHGIPESEYRPCLACHIVEIDGVTYGQARAPGHSKIDWLAGDS